MRPARAVAAAKVNLALVVGERRDDGLHEIASILQRVDVCDRIELEQARGLAVEGFKDDTIVRRALEELGREAQVDPAWRVRITKEIPVAAGLGGGSADAAAALRLANASLERPLAGERLHALAARLGADVPFFLEPGPKLAEGAGEQLTSLDIPQDFWVLLALPPGATKPSTGAVYARFDELGGGAGFAERKSRASVCARRSAAPARPRRASGQRPLGGVRGRAAGRRAARGGGLQSRSERRRPDGLRPLQPPRGRAGRGPRNRATGPDLGGRTRLVTSSHVETTPVIEARERGSGPWLEARRLRLALFIGLVESLAVLLGGVGWFFVLAAAAAMTALYIFVGRRTGSHFLREILWIAAASQLIAVIVPVLWEVFRFLAILALVAMAGILLVILLMDRR